MSPPPPVAVTENRTIGVAPPWRISPLVTGVRCRPRTLSATMAFAVAVPDDAAPKAGLAKRQRRHHRACRDLQDELAGWCVEVDLIDDEIRQKRSGSPPDALRPLAVSIFHCAIAADDCRLRLHRWAVAVGHDETLFKPLVEELVESATIGRVAHAFGVTERAAVEVDHRLETPT
jgi:hypothetical protein